MQDQRRSIVITSTTNDQGLRKLSDQLTKVNSGLKGLNTTASSINNTFRSLSGGILAYFGFSQITQLSDGIQQIRDRLVVLTGSTQKAAQTFEDLQQVAERTRTSVGSLGTIYARIAASANNTTLSTQDLIKVTETLQNSFRISGSTSSEATAVAIQLSQGFASGQLRGQELRSTLEQNVVLAKLLADNLSGGNRGDLYKLAEKGLIDAEKVLRIILDNSKAINADAQKIGITFEQGVTIALDKVAVKLEQINRDLGLSEKFFTAIKFAADNVGVVLSAVGAAIAGLAASAFVKGFAAFVDLFLLLSPQARVLAVAITAVATAFDLLRDKGKDASDELGAIFDRQTEFARALDRRGGAATITDGNLLKNITEEVDRLEAISKLERLARSQGITNPGERSEIADIAQAREEAARRDRIIAEQRKKQAKEREEENKKQRGDFFEINKLYQSGAVDIETYAAALDRVEVDRITKKFVLGKKNLLEFREELVRIDLKEINRSYRDGVITFTEFNEAVKNNKLADLRNELAIGKISLQEYRNELSKISEQLGVGGSIQLGTENFLSNLKTVSQQVAETTEQAFGKLEDNIVNSIKTGKLAFADFANFVLEGFARIIIQQSITKPLASGFLSLFSGGTQAASGTATLGSTLGSVAQPFASGGVVSSPSFFSFGNNKLGMAGEAGPEAILPLTRNSNGDLGVSATPSNVVVNVINNSNSQVQTRESTDSSGNKIIELLIESKVKEGIVKGAFDKSFQQSYGLTRRGT